MMMMTMMIMGEMSESVFHACPKTQSLIYFWQGPLSGLLCTNSTTHRVSVGRPNITHYSIQLGRSKAVKSVSVCEISTHVVTFYLTTKIVIRQNRNQSSLALSSWTAGVLMLWSNGAPVNQTNRASAPQTR